MYYLSVNMCIWQYFLIVGAYVLCIMLIVLLHSLSHDHTSHYHIITLLPSAGAGTGAGTGAGGAGRGGAPCAPYCGGAPRGSGGVQGYVAGPWQ
jgi:hypothetical protein